MDATPQLGQEGVLILADRFLNFEILQVVHATSIATGPPGHVERTSSDIGARLATGPCCHQRRQSASSSSITDAIASSAAGLGGQTTTSTFVKPAAPKARNESAIASDEPRIGVPKS